MLNEALRKAMGKTKKSVSELAEATGIHRVNLSKFKAGKVGLSSERQAKLADALGFQIVVRLVRKSRNLR